MSDIYLGDCREIRSVLADNTVDTIITDPPYGLEFMGKGWDKGVPGVEFWKEFLAIAKPGAMLLAFGGTRTFHRMACAIEDAGWEMRDCMMWLYGSGFPKSHDISKALDARAGAEREVVGYKCQGPRSMFDGGKPRPATLWNGWGTALKPAWEPIIVAMKPTDGTFAENAEKWGVAGLNVDGGRIGNNPGYSYPNGAGGNSFSVGKGIDHTRTDPVESTKGRWPSNLLLDEEAAGMLDGQSGRLSSGKIKTSYHRNVGNVNAYGKATKQYSTFNRSGDSGGASRFFYCAKASPSERNDGCDALEERAAGGMSSRADGSLGSQTRSRNIHPTVKPLKLMEYLCTLTKTPTGGIVLDPFAGSGTTLLAAKNMGREYVGIEQNPEYFEIIKARLGLK